MTALGTAATIGASIAVAGVCACALIAPRVEAPAPVVEPVPVPVEVEERTPPMDRPKPPPIRIVPARDGGLTCLAPRDLAIVRARLEQCECPEADE